MFIEQAVSIQQTIITRRLSRLFITSGRESQTLDDITNPKPEQSDEPKKQTHIDKLIMKQWVKSYIDRKVRFEDDMHKAAAIIVGQCNFTF